MVIGGLRQKRQCCFHRHHINVFCVNHGSCAVAAADAAQFSKMNWGISQQAICKPVFDKKSIKINMHLL